MNILDHYIVQILIFSPLVAAVFITLIPTIDMGSKVATSKFFASVGFFAFVYLFFAFINHKIPAESVFSFGLLNFNINFTLFITKYNIFLYGASSSLLMANMFCHEINDAKTNIHQAAPFVLTFFLYISFGQPDLRVALPILSIANFLVYFMIGHADKIKRGSTIFQMGIFLFACDTLALVLLQIPYANKVAPAYSAFLTYILLIPGSARMLIPMLSPFMKKLILNVDEAEGPFMVMFLQLAGFFILILARDHFAELPPQLSLGIAIIGLVGAFYISLLAITDLNFNILPYYFLVFYSSLSSVTLFISLNNDWWFLSISLFLTNMACAFNATRFAHLILLHRRKKAHRQQQKSIWFLSLGLLLGLPGLGIGTILWVVFYRFINLDIIKTANPYQNLWIGVAIAWIVALILLSVALIQTIKKEDPTSLNTDIIFESPQLIIKRSSLLAPVLVALLSFLIPMVIFYAVNKGI